MDTITADDMAAAKTALWKASTDHQTPQERSRVSFGTCWCGQPRQGYVLDQDRVHHQCRQCADHCAIAAYELLEAAR